jgi:hypothetical protein
MDDDRDQESKGSRLLWVLPALTFVVGLVLGGVLVFVVGEERGDDASPRTPPAPAAPAAPAADDGVTVAVPSACLEAVDQAEAALALAADGFDALGEFDPQRLGAVVDELQRMEPEVRRNAADCRQLARVRPSGG